MKRILFYFLRLIAFCCRLIDNRLYMKFIVAAHRSQGVRFDGFPSYIQADAYLDPSGGLKIENNVVISTKVIILTHDWSFLVRENKKANMSGKEAYRSVRIRENTFIGAGAIVLPGSSIGKSCIIGAGAVIKGTIEDYSIMVGNPAKKIGNTKL